MTILSADVILLLHSGSRLIMILKVSRYIYSLYIIFLWEKYLVRNNYNALIVILTFFTTMPVMYSTSLRTWFCSFCTRVGICLP